MSNIFSPNYSVGTVLCTLQCPGSGMAWWVMAGAKLRLPLIVLSLDFPYSLVSMCGTSALPLPSWPGRLTAQCRGWCGVSSTGCLNSQTPSVWTCLFLISAILLLIQSRWKIPQLCTNLSSCEVSDLLLPPADASCVAPLLWFLSWMPGDPALQPLGSERGLSVQGNEALQHGRWSRAKHPPKESSCSCCSCYSCVLKRALRLWYFFSLESLWLTHEWVRCLPAFFFFLLFYASGNAWQTFALF